MKLSGNPAGWRIINPIKVKYRGITFRSTLEGDWAATLDSLGIGWLYEPEGLVLRSGALYRPDFYLPAIGTWLEVKGPGVPGAEKAFELAEAVRCSCLGIDFANELRAPDPVETRLGSDLCECAWAGGEQVLIGLPSVPGKEDKTRGHGYACWVNPRGPQLGLATCRNCSGAWWAEVQDAELRKTACRHCGTPVELTTADIALSGEVPFVRIKAGWFGRRRAS